MDVIELSNIAIKAAYAAGKVIQNYTNQDVVVQKKEGGSGHASQVVTQVDLEAETAIFSHLLPTCTTFDIALLSEETEDDESRFKKEYFWCIDPLDGTLAFINKQPGFSVSIALVSKDGTPMIGVVFDPSTNTLYHAIQDFGAYKNGIPWKISNTSQVLTYVTDKKLCNTPNKAKIEQMLQEYLTTNHLKELKELSGGGAVLNAINVAEKGPACMIKLPKTAKGGGSIWDFAATACIFKELGLQATSFQGDRLELNKKEDTFMNHQGVFYANF